MPSKAQEAKEFPKYLQKNRKQKYLYHRLGPSIQSKLVGSAGPMLSTTKKVLMWIGGSGAMAATNTTTRSGALAYRPEFAVDGRQW